MKGRDKLRIARRPGTKCTCSTIVRQIGLVANEIKKVNYHIMNKRILSRSSSLVRSSSFIIRSSSFLVHHSLFVVVRRSAFLTARFLPLHRPALSEIPMAHVFTLEALVSIESS